MTLGDALASDRSRSLDLLRLILAAGVIVSHAWPLALGPGTAEPLVQWTGHSLGGWAIGVFFFLSGLLVTGSAERKSPIRFWSARARRIIPGLGVALLVTLALACASGSTVAGPEGALWFLRAVTLVSIEHRLPEAFAANPYSEVVNGPLWSLFYEVLAYAICASFVWAGGARYPKAIWALLACGVALGLVQDILPGRAATFAPLFTSFALGMLVYLWRDRIPLTMTIILGAVGVAAIVPSALSLAPLAFALVALVLRGPILAVKSDASYGMYIYGWPVAQTLVAMLPGIDPVSLAGLSVAATYPVAWASWHLVERPALSNRMAVA